MFGTGWAAANITAGWGIVAAGAVEGITVGVVGRGTGSTPLMVPAPSGNGFSRLLVNTGRILAALSADVDGGRAIVVGTCTDCCAVD